MPSAFLRVRMLLWRTSLTGRKSMIRSFMIAVASAAVFTLSTTAFAQGTASEAKAMLEKAVAAVKADKAKALDTINKGEGGFLDRDLYVFCFNSGDGNIVATGTSNPAGRKVIGQNVKTLKDATGKLYGPDLYAAAKEGQITEVSYMFPKPGTDTTPVAKVSFVTKAGDLGCGVGYYK
jgi:signal transduction histidine kinase